MSTIKKYILVLQIGVLVVFLLNGKALLQDSNKNIATAEISSSTNVAIEIESILKDERLKGALSGISIRNGQTGELLYSHLGEIRLHPASNMKILTAAAALEVLGKDYSFTTEIWTTGKIKGNVLHGDLYIKGKGDPTLMKADLDLFAKDLLAKGIQRIEGSIIADDSWYDDVRLSKDLNWSDESAYWGAQISALTLSPTHDYDAGTVLVEMYAGKKEGAPPEVTVTPHTTYMEITNHAKTVHKEEKNTISLNKKHGTNSLVIDGAIPLHSEKHKSWVAVWEPTFFTLDVLKSSFIENGITVTYDKKLMTGTIPKKATLLTYKKSIPLKELIIPFMKLSNNTIGEMLTKEMGKVIYGEGSWDKGIQVIKDTVRSLGMDASTIQIRDGSGISHINMIPANELSQFLYHIQDKDWFAAFKHSLPVAGMQDRLVGGSLRNRLNDEPVKGHVFAKTGTITGASTLSGYVITQSGQEWIFSIMLNNYLVESDVIKSIEDQIVKTLVKY